MHASPAMVMYALRWHPSAHVQNLAAMSPEAAKAFSTGGFRDIVGNAMVLYLVWAVGYYLKVRFSNGGGIHVTVFDLHGDWWPSTPHCGLGAA